jgi:hypothetical protein
MAAGCYRGQQRGKKNQTRTHNGKLPAEKGTIVASVFNVFAAPFCSVYILPAHT